MRSIRTERPDSFLYILAELVLRLIGITIVLGAILTLTFFPWGVDAPLTPAEQERERQYYATAYQKETPLEEKEDTLYVKIAEAAAAANDITGEITRVASNYGLGEKKVLDVGAGRGYLQDIVDDYTGLDISPSVKRFFHKPFVLASATAMPFPDNQFDAAWSVWVLEHVPNPEAALSEIRRVVRDGGLLYLKPAWNVRPWNANGYLVRPFSDFSAGGKFIKASIPIQDALWLSSKPLILLIRYGTWNATRGPTRFHYSRLTPNYDHYWMGDSDAVNSLDRFEMAIWFLSRGDECLNCEGAFNGMMHENNGLLIRIHKH